MSTIHVRSGVTSDVVALARAAAAAFALLALCLAALLVDVVAASGSHLAAAGVGFALDIAVGIPVGYHWRRPVCTVVIDPEGGS
ncbi:MAG TPA: hypothetical protein VHX38_02890 [Pseudonocardiaceae bacterium]|nr:hypothetical protein [Pseudonocardiaceae bacterium]